MCGFEQKRTEIVLVALIGFEPTLPRGKRILNPSRLPISPQSQSPYYRAGAGDCTAKCAALQLCVHQITRIRDDIAECGVVVCMEWSGGLSKLSCPDIAWSMKLNRQI